MEDCGASDLEVTRQERYNHIERWLAEPAVHHADLWISVEYGRATNEKEPYPKG